MTLDANGICEQVGIGLTNVGSHTAQGHSAEALLQGKRLDQDSITQAAQLAAEAASPKQTCVARSSTSAIWCGC